MPRNRKEQSRVSQDGSTWTEVVSVSRAASSKISNRPAAAGSGSTSSRPGNRAGSGRADKQSRPADQINAGNVHGDVHGTGRRSSPRLVNSGASSSRPRSSSQAQFHPAQVHDDGSNDVWVCKLCDNEFDQPDDKLVVCSRCEDAFCIACLRMPDSHYQVLCSSGSGLHWYCPDCKESALHAVRDDFEIEERCEAFFTRMSARMDFFEATIAKKADVSVTEQLKRNVDKLCGDSEGTWMSIDSLFKEIDQLKSANSTMTETVTSSFVAEMDARDKRKQNLIFFNVEESDSDLVASKEHDASVAANLIAGLAETEVDISDCRRLGQRKDRQGNVRPRPRPLRVSVASQLQRDGILRKAGKLKESDANRHIVIRKDMTPLEREQHRANARKWRAQNTQRTQNARTPLDTGGHAPHQTQSDSQGPSAAKPPNQQAPPSSDSGGQEQQRQPKN